MKGYKDELKYALDIMHEQSRFAETKNVSMIVFSSALFVGILSNINEIRNFIIIDSSILPVFNENAYKIFILSILITLFISFIFSILAFFPKINQKSFERFDGKKNLENDSEKKDEYNLLFFDTNRKFSSSEALYQFYSNKYKDVETYNKDIANQIYNLSIIARWKYDCFSRAIKCCTCGFGISILLTIIIWIISK